MHIRDQLRQNIRDMREDRQLTQADMAEKLSMSVTGYAKLERGESQIRVERLQQIAQVLEANVEELMAGSSDGVVVFNNSTDILNNSPNFSFAIGNPALESEITRLRYVVDAKNELLESREREIESLKSHIEALQKIIETLEK